MRRLSPSASWERGTTHSSKTRGQAADALACSVRRPSWEPLRGPPGRHGRVPAVASAASRGRKARTADGNGARPVEMGSKPRQTQPRARTPRSAPFRRLSSSPFPVLGLRCECPRPRTAAAPVFCERLLRTTLQDNFLVICISPFPRIMGNVWMRRPDRTINYSTAAQNSLLH